MFEIIMYVSLGIGALLAAEGIYFLIRYSSEKERVRLRQRLRRVGEPGGAGLMRMRRMAKTPGLDRFLRMFPYTERIEGLLVQTDLNWTVAQLVGMSLLLAVVLGGGVLVLTPHMAVLAFGAFVLGLVIPPAIATGNRTKRNKNLSKQLPDALDMMSRSLRAGHGISAGFKLVATEMPPPIAVEFGRCFEEHNLGADFRDAVTNMTERAPKNLDLKLFAVSLVIQAETGGNLAEILEQIATTIRERFTFFGKLRALTAEVKISATVISFTPFIFAAVMTSSKPEYLLPLITDPTGQLFLLSAIVLWIVGWILIRNLSRVDY